MGGLTLARLGPLARPAKTWLLMQNEYVWWWVVLWAGWASVQAVEPGVEAQVAQAGPGPQ